MVIIHYLKTTVCQAFRQIRPQKQTFHFITNKLNQLHRKPWGILGNWKTDTGQGA
jgi:hypothetical protein